jgi:hypothetical protein
MSGVETNRATVSDAFHMKRVTTSGAFGLNATVSGAFNPYKLSTPLATTSNLNSHKHKHHKHILTDTTSLK